MSKFLVNSFVMAKMKYRLKRSIFLNNLDKMEDSFFFAWRCFWGVGEENNLQTTRKWLDFDEKVTWFRWESNLLSMRKWLDFSSKVRCFCSLLIINTLQRRYKNSKFFVFRPCSTTFLSNKKRSKMFTSEGYILFSSTTLVCLCFCPKPHRCHLGQLFLHFARFRRKKKRARLRFSHILSLPLQHRKPK